MIICIFIRYLVTMAVLADETLSVCLTTSGVVTRELTIQSIYRDRHNSLNKKVLLIAGNSCVTCRPLNDNSVKTATLELEYAFADPTPSQGLKIRKFLDIFEVAENSSAVI